MEHARPSTRSIVKFVALSAVGLASFLLPVQYGGQRTTILSALTEMFESLLAPIMNYIVVALISFSLLASIWDYVLTRANRPVTSWIHEMFGASVVYILSKLLTLVIVIMCFCNIGPRPFINTASDMTALGSTLVCLALAMSFLLVFLTDSGIMEFFGEFTRPFMRPVFKLPPHAALDIVASWFSGASGADVILTNERYKEGLYTKREAASIMCNFSLVALPFCVVICEIGRVEEYAGQIYVAITLLGIVLGGITPRLYPLSKVEDSYSNAMPRDVCADERHSLGEALAAACATADKFSLQTVLSVGSSSLFSIIFSIMPVAISWGTLGMILVNYTPLFNWVSIPMGCFLQLLGVEEAFEVAPTTLVGFVDQYIPCLLLVEVESVRTRFVITALSLVQIIYISIVGATILQANVGMSLWKLFLVFMERTLISLPLLVLAANLVVA